MAAVLSAEVKRAAKNLLDNRDFGVLMDYIYDLAVDDILASSEKEVFRNLTRFNAVNDIRQLMVNIK